MNRQAVIKALRVIPGVGPAMADDLFRLGIREVGDLKGRDPEELYSRFNRLSGRTVDRCVLYVFRAAVYYASHEQHDPDRLKWWNWKDPKLPAKKKGGGQ